MLAFLFIENRHPVLSLALRDKFRSALGTREDICILEISTLERTKSDRCDVMTRKRLELAPAESSVYQA